MKKRKEPQKKSIKTRIITSILFCTLTTLFLGWYYGDVLHIAQQYSFFTTNPEQMKFVTDNSPYGYLWLIGRALLQPYYYPFLGGLLTALILTITAILTVYTFKLRGNNILIAYILPLSWIIYTVYSGFDLYYQTETGKILGIPFCVLLILLLQALFVSTFTKRKLFSKTFLLEKDSTPKQMWIRASLLLLCFSGIITFNELKRAYVRPTTYMQRCMWQQDWDAMIACAQECKVSCRPIAAYYAIALSQKDLLNEHLFDIQYNYEDLYLHNRTHHSDYGTSMYEADCNFYAGLLLPANRCAIEKITMEGPSAYYLKRLALIALANNENELCAKYLKILETLPFEGQFTDKYKKILQDEHLRNNDPEISKVKLMEPTYDNFEYNFRQPTFLGYNVVMLEGRSLNALKASIAACLYTKLMPDFLLRTQPLIGSTPTGSIADALTMESTKNSQIGKVFRINAFARNKYQNFLNEAKRFMKNKNEGQKQLFDQYKGYYPYYYYFGNLPSKSNQKINQTINKSGVN